MAIDPKFTELLKSKNDIVDVVSGYCALEQRGGNLWARCPLPGHSERTASFSVNAYGQFFKCFGCGRGGDVITFVMEMESLSYYDTVKHLAERAGLTLPETFKEERRTNDDYKKKDAYLNILRDTAKFYVANLRSGKATEHEKYLEKRGLTKQTITAFGIGASLDYSSLPEFLFSKGYSKEDAVAAGVLSENDRGVSDFEAKRLIFPIINPMGEVIAFGGRVLEKTDFGKYKNTRETSVFIKNKTLYNLNGIKKLKSAGELKEIIIVEGYMDTVSLVSAGFKNVVASMGTSLTKEQARLLKRYTENVLICYDGDFAGRSANIRGLEILRAEGLNVKVVALPDGMDPDDVIKKLGPEAYAECLKNAMPLVDFKLHIVREKFDDGTAYGKRKYIEKAIEVIRECDAEAEREELLRNLSKDTGITYQSLLRDMEKSPKTQVIAPNPLPARKSAGRLDVAERYVLAYLIKGGDMPEGYCLELLRFTEAHRAEMARYISNIRAAGMKVNPTALYDYMGEEGREEAEEVLMLIGGEIMEKDGGKFLADCLKLMERTCLEDKIEELKRLADAEPDLEKRKEITRKIMEAATRLRAL